MANTRLQTPLSFRIYPMFQAPNKEVF